MNESPQADEVLVDLLRSAWVVEAARALVYDTWSETEARFEASAARARAAAGLVAASLAARGKATDRALVEPHAEWMMELVGRQPGLTPFSDIFIARLGDWVEGHAAGLLDGAAAELEALGEEERAALTFPEQLPQPPPFEPVATPAAGPPGDVLFRFAVLADLHFGSPTGEVMAEAAIADINASGAELVIQLGDITDRGNKDEFELAARALQGLHMPVHAIIGNHDVYSYDEGRLAGREYFRQAFGREPEGALIEHKGVRLALLDTADHAVSPFAPFDLASGQFLGGHGGAIVRGTLSVAQHEILAEVAAPNTPPAFVFLHHPPQPFTSFPPVVFGLRDADSGRLHAVCDSGNVWGVFAGHTHRNRRPRTFGDVVVQEVGIPRDYPFGYALVDVTEHGYAYRFLQISDEELLRTAYDRVGVIHRRYALGRDFERAFTWRKG